MPRILISEAFTSKHVPQMSAAVGASDFCANTIGVREPLDCAGDFLVKAWPAAAGFKLALRTIKRCSAAFADVGASFPKRVVFAGEGNFCGFALQDVFFLEA